MNDYPFNIYTHTVCNTDGDMPDWMFYAVCALPLILLAIDFL